MSSRIGDLTLLNVLGKGSFGTVFLSKKDGKNCYFATKQIDRAMADKPSYQKYFKNELLILKGLNHPNIVHLEDLKSDNKYYYIVMEYINGGSLTDCLQNYKKRNNGKSFPEEIVQHLMRQIVAAIKYIHNKNIIHRDLKLDNIMVNFQNEYDKNNCNMLKSTIKIIDFGFAIQLSPSQNNLTHSVLGSPINMDPAILKEMAQKGKKVDQLGYDQKADIWSLGTICYELLIGKSVFNAETMNELVSKVENGNYTVPTSVSSEIITFLNGMLQYEGKNRFSADELANHPFLTKDCRNFTRMNINRVQKKVVNNQLNVNVKRNHTIWSIYNEEDEKKLLNINTKNIGAAPPLQPIPEYPQFLPDPKRTKTDLNIQRVPQNNYINRNYNKSYSNNYPYYGPVNSIYGQNMMPNQGPPMPQYPNPNQYPQYVPPTSQSQIPQAYSSGMGGYNKSDYPTFSPAPYTFASNIYQQQNSSPPSMGYGPNYMAPPSPPYMPQPPYGYSPLDNDQVNGCRFQ